jgi:type I restriction enzyme S subunit
MEVKPGYKQTEVGVIPEAWEVKPIIDCCEYADYRGKTPPKTQSGTFLVTARNVRKGFIDYADSQEFVSSALYDQIMRRGKPRIGDVLITTEAPLGNVAQIDREDVALAQRVIKYRPKIDGLLATYLKHYFLSDRFQQILDDHSSGTTAKGIKGRVLHQLPVALPPLPEQRAIATALSDVDGLLGGLDRLIAKKRDLKQAAMQKLLTGQTRLPGFHGEWEVKRLKQVAEISTGINKPLSEMGSGALYVTVQDLYDKTSIRTERLSRIKVSPSEIETRGLTSGDIVFGKSSVKRDGIGYPSQFLGCDEPVVFSGFTYRARARQGITDATFLFYALREEKTRRWLIDNSQASALTNINQTIADAIPVQVPPSVPEQTAIAEVLTDMDAELAALEQRREKTRALKQAMMQELLTGRTRLV